MDIRIFKTLADLNQSFTAWFQDILAEKEDVTIALSGGSTPRSLFDYWAQLPEGEIDWRKIKFFWGDERCVAPTDDESNYKMTKEHLFRFVPVPDKISFAFMERTTRRRKPNGTAIYSVVNWNRQTAFPLSTS